MIVLLLVDRNCDVQNVLRTGLIIELSGKMVKLTRDSKDERREAPDKDMIAMMHIVNQQSKLVRTTPPSRNTIGISWTFRVFSTLSELLQVLMTAMCRPDIIMKMTQLSAK
jgi:hypothetical protein